MTEVPFATVAPLLDAVAARYPTREAMVSDDERVTFGAFRARAERLAAGLTALGLGHGDAVAIWMPNRPSWFVAQQACARTGAVVVALDARCRGQALDRVLRGSDARALILTDHVGSVDYFELLHEVLPELADAVPGELTSERFPRLAWVIVDADDEYPGCVRLADIENVGTDRPTGRSRSPAPDDAFALVYTSGTSGIPKATIVSHRNCVPHAWHTGQTLRLTPGDRVLHALPASGAWGGVNIPLSTWSHAATLVMMETFDPLRALWLIERERCTIVNVSDTMAGALLDHAALARYDRSSLRTGAFAAVGGRGQLFDEVADRIVPDLYQPYGTTEINAMALAHDLDEPRARRAEAGVVPPPGLEVRVADPATGAVCRPGQDGELQFRGSSVSRGYHGLPEATAAAFTFDGWFKTGDVGVQDDSGRTIFKGRLKETPSIDRVMTRVVQ